MRNVHQAVRVLLACPAVIGLLAGDLTAQAGSGSPGASPASPQRAARLQKERDNVELQTAVPPFKAFDNLYYVGVGYVSSWLLTTDQGLILVDTLEERYVDRLLDNIRMEGDFNLFNGIGGAKPEARAPRRDMIVKDGDTLTLGNTTLRLAWHPGHTPGGLSAGFTIYDGGKPESRSFPREEQ